MDNACNTARLHGTTVTGTVSFLYVNVLKSKLAIVALHFQHVSLAGRTLTKSQGGKSFPLRPLLRYTVLYKFCDRHLLPLNCRRYRHTKKKNKSKGTSDVLVLT